MSSEGAFRCARGRSSLAAMNATDLPDTGADGDTGARHKRGSTTGTPRWVTVLGIVIAVLLIVGFVVMHLTGALGSGLHS